MNVNVRARMTYCTAALYTATSDMDCVDLNAMLCRKSVEPAWLGCSHTEPASRNTPTDDTGWCESTLTEGVRCEAREKVRE